MSSGWRRILARLSHTGWDELKTRGGQEFHKRFDFAQYRAGLRHSSDRLAVRGPWGTFFFPPNEIPGRISLLKKNLPAEVEKIIREADDICRLRFALLGYENL